MFRNIQVNRKSRTFATADEALAWIAQTQKHLVTDGRAVEDVVAAYLESLAGAASRRRSRRSATASSRS